MKTLKPLAAAIALALAPAAYSASVTGVIKDKNGVLAGAEIRIKGAAAAVEATTDYKGKFELLKLPAGEYELAVSYLGYSDKTIAITVDNETDIKALGTLLLNVDEVSLEEMFVVGQITQGEMAAANIQKNSGRIMNVISSDGIGKLPDRNAAEAVQRVPGVSIERDMGEGRFVAIRGLPSQWSSATVNGNRLPTAEQETSSRATAFDFFPSEMIEYVEVTKAITPDMEGDAIGGNVNFITRSAPDDFVLNVSGAVGAHELADGVDSSANILYGDRVADGRFGYIINANVWNRNWATDNYEPRRGDDGTGVYRLELRDYTGERTTYGLNVGAEYLLDAGRVFVNGIYGTLEDDETHYKHRQRFDRDRVEVQHIYNEMITEMTGLEIGGEHALNIDTTLDWKLATFDNEFRYDDAPNVTDNSYFVALFDQRNVGFIGLEDRGTGKDYAYNEVDGGTDSWNHFSNHLPSDFTMDPASMRLTNIQLYKGYINEKDKIVAELDLKYQFSDTTELKFGLKYRDKERISTFSDEFYVWDSSDPVPVLADFTLRDQSGRNDFLSELNGGYAEQFVQVAGMQELMSFWNDNRDKFRLDEAASALISNGAALGRHFNVYEEHTSGFAMATYDAADKWTITGGVRLTQTDTNVEGYTHELDADGNDSVAPNSANKNYLSILPSLHIKYAQSDNLNYRFALSRTFARPDFGFLSPGSTYREADNELVSGNPDVDPTYSNNVDVMVEYYFDNVGLVSAGFFYKDISDPIFQDFEVGEYSGRTGVVKYRPENGDDASLTGVEFAFNRSLSFISESMENFGIQANVTLMDSEMTIPGRDDSVNIPRQADNLYNAAVYYEGDRFTARLAVNHKGSYVEEHGSSPEFDTYYGDYTSVDMTASYSLTDRAIIFLELNNLTDEPLYYYLGNEGRPLQLEYYGAKGMMGVNYKF